jgi:hypothetical protein
MYVHRKRLTYTNKISLYHSIFKHFKDLLKTGNLLTKKMNYNLHLCCLVQKIEHVISIETHFPHFFKIQKEKIFITPIYIERGVNVNIKVGTTIYTKK